MPSVVVDTDVVSFAFKGGPLAARYAPHLLGRTLVISFMTLAKLERWAIKHNWSPARRAALQQHLQRFVVQHSTAALCRQWAAVVTAAERRGQIIAGADAWHAATALLLGIPLISQNRKLFVGVPGLTLSSEAP